MTKHKKIFDEKRMVVAVCGGVVIAIAVSILLTAIGVLCIQNEYLKMDMLGILAHIIQFFAVFSGAVFACKFYKSKLILLASIVAAGNFLVCLLTAMLLYDGVGDGFLLSLAATILGCLSGIALCLKEKTALHKRKNTRRPR